LPGRDVAVFSVTAAVGQRANLVPHGKLTDTRTERHHFTGHFQTGNRIHARLHRVLACPLQGVGAIDPGGMHANQHFAGCGDGQGHTLGLQDFGATRLSDFDTGHFAGQSHVDSCCLRF
jgi:hypothetical protein